jgi:parallel beta-helix repeat protein
MRWKIMVMNIFYRGHAPGIVGLILLAMILLTGSAGAATNISSCRHITAAGVYVLNASLTNSVNDACIYINSSDVILDGAGYTIDGVYQKDFNDGVHVVSLAPIGLNVLTNITIENLIVKNSNRGIYYQNANNGNITNFTAFDMRVYAIDLGNSSDNNLTGNTATNTWDGILLELSNNNTLTNNTASNSEYIGIVLSFSSGNTLTGNNASNNGWDGFNLFESRNNNFINNIASHNTRWAFYLFSDSINNTVVNLTMNPTVSFTGNDIAIRADTAPALDPNGYRNISIFINATNTTPNNPWLFLNVSYSNAEIAGMNGNTLRMWQHDGSWLQVPGINGVNTAQNYVYANITSFSIFAPMANITTPPPRAPNITSFAPPSPVNNTVGASRTFNITVNQTVNVTWYINGTEVINQSGVTDSAYINNTAVVGFWNVTAIANNTNGMDSKTWDWNVSAAGTGGDPSGGAPVPAISMAGMFALIGMLVVAAVLSLRKKRGS